MRGRDNQEKQHFQFSFISRLNTEKEGSCRSRASQNHWPQVHQVIIFVFFLLKSKSSGIPTSRSSLVYTLNMYELAILQHAHSSWSVFLYPLDADGALETMLPVFRENLDCYYSSTTYSCLWVRIYFWISFSHQTISVSSASSLTQLIYWWEKSLPSWFTISKHEVSFPLNLSVYFIPE